MSVASPESPQVEDGFLFKLEAVHRDVQEVNQKIRSQAALVEEIVEDFVRLHKQAEQDKRTRG